MADTPTKVPLATTTLTTTTATVTFSGISSAYKDLILVVAPWATAGNYDLGVRFNSDTSGNYSWTSLRFNADDSANVISDRGTNDSAIKAKTNIAVTVQYPLVIQINNYSNSSIYKNALIRTARSEYATSAVIGLWRNTSAITSISFDLYGGGSASFTSGTVATLYGIL